RADHRHQTTRRAQRSTCRASSSRIRSPSGCFVTGARGGSSQRQSQLRAEANRSDGGGMTTSTLFVGRKRELKKLCDTINRGESVLLVGGRRAGKTRLLDQLHPVRRSPGVALSSPLQRPIYFSDAGEWQLDREGDAINALLESLL